jgi:type IV pilus assembly protein PilA
MLIPTLLQFVSEPAHPLRTRGTMKTTHLSLRSSHLPFRSARLSFRSAAEESASSPSPDSGFTLVELLIVMSIMLIIMAFAVPSMLKLQKNAHESSAIQSVKTIAASELSYNVGGAGYACPLSALGDVKTGTSGAPAAELIDPALATSGQKAGYTFTVTCGSKVTIANQDVYNSFTVTAVPQTIGKTGDRGFCSDESNIVKFDPAGGTNCTQHIQ